MSDVDQPGSGEVARAGEPNVAPDVSVFWKPLERLFRDGNPVDPVTVLLYDMGDGKRLPFAAIAKTRNNRLILWPPSSAAEPGEFADGHPFPVHHVTLELANGETHFTRFDKESRRIHEDPDWKLASLEGGARLWLVCAFRVALLEKQIGIVEGSIGAPRTDSKRREDEFRRYAAMMTTLVVGTPPLRGDCFVTVIHLLPDSTGVRTLAKPSHFPMGSFWNDWIDAWPDGDKFPVAPTEINIGGVNLLLLTGSPLGRLKGACILGSASLHSGKR